MAEECIVNTHNMLYELPIVWHTISLKQRQALGMSPVEIRGDVKLFSNTVLNCSSE